MKAIVPHENFVAPGVCLYPPQDLRNAQVLSKLLATVDPDPGHLTRKENIDYFHLEYLPKTIHTWMLSSGRLHLFVKYIFLVINQFWMTVDCILLHMFFVREYVEICRCILMSLEYSILPTWETSDVLRVLKRSVHSIQGAFSVFLLACTNTNVDDLHVNYRTLRWLYIILFSHLSFTWSDPENGGSTDPPIMRARIT